LLPQFARLNGRGFSEAEPCCKTAQNPQLLRVSLSIGKESHRRRKPVLVYLFGMVSAAMKQATFMTLSKHQFE